MLVISRKIGQSIKIGNDTEIVVLGVKNGRVTLGTTAPETVRVVRSELLEPRKGSAA